MPSKTPAIATHKLHRRFTRRRRLFTRGAVEEQDALVDVTLDVDPGQCVAVIGPNGAGKSTLIRVLATLVSPTGGSASVSGFDVVREGNRVREQIGFVSTDHRSFFWPLTALENLAFFGELQGMSRGLVVPRARSLLGNLGLEFRDERPVSDFSTGMRQRVAIARALLHDPSVLLLDEPTAGLDRKSRGVVIDLFRRNRESRRRTMLIATHDAELVTALADRTVRMDGGRLTELRDEVSITYRIVARLGAGASFETAGRVAQGRDGTAMIDVADTGDGYALSSTISSLVASGGEIISIETRKT
ncbi:MAG: ABC transporter ATP-binding protein [Chloroflexota bacterium]